METREITLKDMQDAMMSEKLMAAQIRKRNFRSFIASHKRGKVKWYMRGPNGKIKEKYRR